METNLDRSFMHPHTAIALVYFRTLAVVVLIGTFALGAPASAQADFVPNPQCTIGNTWDPVVDPPDHEALAQLAPTGELHVGVFTGNGAIAQQNPTTGLLSGP